jgi:hypothetical protein
VIDGQRSTARRRTERRRSVLDVEGERSGDQDWGMEKYLPRRYALEGIRPRHVGRRKDDGTAVGRTVPAVRDGDMA